MSKRLGEADWPSPEIQSEISDWLSGRGGPGTRAGIVLRKYPDVFAGFSLKAKIVYVHLSGMMGLDKDDPTSIAVPMKTIAKWLNSTQRSAQNAIRELTRSGPLPLLKQEIGRTGRVSRYRFVEDPFAEALRQEQTAARVKKTRRPRLVAERNAAFLAHQRGETTNEQLTDDVRAAEGRAAWALPTRSLPKPEPQLTGRGFRP